MSNSQLPEGMDFEIRVAISRLKQLIDSRILWEETNVWYKHSVYIEVLIRLRDLMAKADKLGNPIDFTDDVAPNNHPRFPIRNIYDLITNFRDAECHPESHRRKFGNNVIGMIILRGKNKWQLNELIIECKYDDDIVFTTGENTIYLKRHIERVYQELKDFFKPLIGFPYNADL